jgi:hypothetical protein
VIEINVKSNRRACRQGVTPDLASCGSIRGCFTRASLQTLSFCVRLVWRPNKAFFWLPRSRVVLQRPSAIGTFLISAPINASKSSGIETLCGFGTDAFIWAEMLRDKPRESRDLAVSGLAGFLQRRASERPAKEGAYEPGSVSNVIQEPPLLHMSRG